MYSIIVFSIVVCSVLALPPGELNNPATEPNNALTEPKVLANEKSPTIANVDTSVRYVYGGIRAPEGAHPYIVALSRGSWIRMLMCGASIVTKRSIVTAGHCIHAVYANGALSDTLRGTVGTNQWEEGKVMYTFTHNATHPHFIHPIKKNDIGILFTSKDIVFTTLIKPIALDYDFVGKDVPLKVAGWGKTEAKGNPWQEAHSTELRLNTHCLFFERLQEGYSSYHLLELTVETIDGESCVADVAETGKNLKKKPFPVEPHIEICTYHSRSHGTCKGDSGGPLVRPDNTKLVGIVSWGFPCAVGAPDVYARISAFKEWLEKVIV